MPKAKISVMISERYSLTLGSSSIGGLARHAAAAWPREKLHHASASR